VGCGLIQLLGYSAIISRDRFLRYSLVICARALASCLSGLSSGI
jgi:hypothetical protein